MESSSYSVLIIEDEYPARMLMMDYIMNCSELKLSGIAESGDKALNLLQEKQFDLVFMDINLPAVNGMDILRKEHNKSTFLLSQLLIANMQSKHLIWMRLIIY